MTQTTLYSDKQLFVSLYKSALRRLKGIGIIYALISFIAFPVFYIMQAFEAAERISQGYSYHGFEGNPEIYSAVTIIFYFAVIIAGAVLISVYCNSFMHNRRAVDVFHALPVKRHQQLMANFCAVITVLLGAQFLCYGVVAVVNAATVGEPFVAVLLEALRVALLTVVITVIAFFCSVCCNAGLDSAVFSGALMAIVPAYTLLVMLLMDQFVVGFDGSNQVLKNSVKFSPAAMLYQTFFVENMPQDILLNAIYVLFAVALMALTCHLYKKRKSEMAQSANTKNPLYQFIILAASTGGGVFFGVTYHNIWGSRYDDIVALGITSCVFTLAIYLVFNAVMARNPRPTKRGMTGLGVSLALVVVFLFFVNNGFFGFETYVPATEDIESVTINYAGDYFNVSEASVNKNGNVYHYTRNSTGTTFTDPDEIDMVKEIHSGVVEHIGKDYTEIFHKSLFFEYKLKNGQTVRRYYTDGTPVELVKKLVALEDLETFKIQNFPALKENVENVTSFDIKDGFGNNAQTLRNLTKAQKEKLYNAIAQDTINITRQMKDQRMGPVLARIGINYVTLNEAVGNYVKSEETTAAVVSLETAEIVGRYTNYAYDYERMYTNVVFDVTQDCINTIRVLEELGLGQYTTLEVPENLRAVVFASYHPLDYSSNKPYWTTNWSFEQYEFMEPLRYEEPTRIAEYTVSEQISQLVNNSQTGIYAPSQEKILYSVTFIDADVDWRSLEMGEYDFMSYYITSNNAPDFVKQDLALYADEPIYFSSITKFG